MLIAGSHREVVEINDTEEKHRNLRGSGYVLGSDELPASSLGLSDHIPLARGAVSER